MRISDKVKELVEKDKSMLICQFPSSAAYSHFIYITAQNLTDYAAYHRLFPDCCRTHSDFSCVWTSRGLRQCVSEPPAISFVYGSPTYIHSLSVQGEYTSTILSY